MRIDSLAPAFLTNTSPLNQVTASPLSSEQPSLIQHIPASEPVMAVVSFEVSAEGRQNYAAYLAQDPAYISGFAKVMQRNNPVDTELAPSLLNKISKEAKASYKQNGAYANHLGSARRAIDASLPGEDISLEDDNINHSQVGATAKIEECQTCKNRMYVDDSSDPSVSFQSPGNIRPDVALSVVAAHEGEHVANEQIRAKQGGGRVVSQSVSIHTSICPECGRVYVSGGETKTLMAIPSEEQQNPSLHFTNEEDNGAASELTV